MQTQAFCCQSVALARSLGHQTVLTPILDRLSVLFLCYSFLIPRDSSAGPRKICRVNLGLQQIHSPAVLALPAGPKTLLRTMALGVRALEGTQALERGTGPARVGKEQGKGAPGSGPAGVASLAMRRWRSAARVGAGGSQPRTG